MIANAILKLGDGPPRERPAQQPPQPRVVWRIHVEHHLPDMASRPGQGHLLSRNSSVEAAAGCCRL
jgi:hypothetical protein